jgi:hypothetical protein
MTPGQSDEPPGGAGYFPYPPGSYPPLQYPGFAPVPPSNGLAVAALVIGIFGLLTSPFCIGLGLGIAAVAMGVTARRRAQRGEATDSGLALGGIVLGAVAIAIGAIVSAIVGVIIVVGVATDQFNETYQHCLGEHNGHSESCEQYR